MYSDKLKNQFRLKKYVTSFSYLFVNNFLGLLICKINLFSASRMVDFLKIFVLSGSIENAYWISLLAGNPYTQKSLVKTMASGEGHLRYCILFALQLKKKCSWGDRNDLLRLRKTCGDIKRVKSGSRDFAMVILTFPSENDLVSWKNSKTRNWSNSWRKILLKRKKNLQSFSLLSKQFLIATNLFVLY